MSATVFNQLSTEIKCKIYDSISAKERQKLRIIEKSWDNLINQIHGITMIFNNRNWNIVLCCQAQSIHAIFQNFTYPIFQVLKGRDLASRFNSLTLDGIIACYNMIPLFQECCNLKRLEFGKIKGTCPDLKPDIIDLENSNKLLPALKILKINFYRRRTILERRKYNDMLESLLPFLGCKTSRSKLTCIEFQYNTRVKDLRAGFYPGALEENWISKIYIPNLKLHEIFINNLISNNSKTLSELRTKIFYKEFLLKFHPVGEDGTRHTQSVIEEFKTSNKHCNYFQYLKTQTRMKVFIVTEELHGFEWHNINDIFASNSDTLTKICLTNDQSQGFHRSRQLFPHYQFDGLAFYVLQNLKYLTFLSQTLRKGNIWRGRRSELLNIQFLPSTICILKLSLTIVFANEEWFNEETFGNLKNLKVFEFSAHPWFLLGERRITYLISSRIRKLIEWLPKLTTLKLRCRSLPFRQERTTPTKTLPNSSITWILSSNGITYQKKRVKKSDGCRFFDGTRYEYFVNISIEQQFRNSTVTNKLAMN